MQPKLNRLLFLLPGVPVTMRPWVWLEVSGAAKKKAAHAANYYSIMVKAGETSPFAKEIEQVRSKLPLLIIAAWSSQWSEGMLTWVVPAHFLLGCRTRCTHSPIMPGWPAPRARAR